jgi:hypothetical protein
MVIGSLAISSNHRGPAAQIDIDADFGSALRRSKAPFKRLRANLEPYSVGTVSL